MSGLAVLPAGLAAARMVSRHVAAADLAWARMRGRLEPDALHDFRVALRRLRSAQRAWADVLGRAATPKLQARVRQLATGTGPAREAEAALAWLETQRAHLRRAERAGLNHMVRLVRGAMRDAYGQARVAVRRDWPTLRDRLVERLGQVPDGDATLGTLLPDRRRDAEAALQRALAGLRGPEDAAAAHRARIRAKRLRYLLEPLREDFPALTAPVAELRRLQDLLGTWHDAHELAGRLRVEAREAGERARPGLEALGMRNRVRLLAAAREAVRTPASWSGAAAGSA